MALTREDGEAIVAAADRAGRMLLVGLVLRHWPEYQRLHELVAEGAIGAVRSVSALRLSPPADWADWFIDPAQSGGVAVDLMVHDFDQLNALLGPATTVHAQCVRRGAHGAPQHVVAVTSHPGGAGLAEGGMMLPASYPFTSGVRVLGDAGILEYPFAAGPAVDGGNIGGVDQEAEPPAAAPGRGRGVAGRGRERRPVAPPGRLPGGLRSRRGGPRRTARASRHWPHCASRSRRTARWNLDRSRRSEHGNGIRLR